MTAAAVSSPRPEVLLIDLSSLYWTSWHATSANSSSEAAKLTQTAIDRCIGELDGKLVAICVDQGRSFRKELAPEYKANRPEKDQSALNELANLKERLRERGYWLAGADGFEADDVIATLAHAASAAGHPVRIASADKDLLQLLALPETTALRTHTWTSVRAVDVVTKFGVEPEGLRDWLALVGDKSDNVAGCPGVGEKRATELLVKFFDLDRLYDAIDKLAVTLPGADAPIVQTMTPEARKVATPAIVQALWDNREAVKLARKLVTLRTDAPVKFDDIYERREPKNTTKGKDMDATDVEFDDARISAPPKEEQPPKAPAPAQTAPSVAPSSNGTSAAPAPAESVALTVIPGPFEMQLEPTSLGTAFKLGQALYESRLYTRFPTAQAITAVIVRGREMGIGALTALDCFHVVEGKPYASAHLLIARAKSDPDCEYFQMVDMVPGESCTWETKNRRNPKPTRYTYTRAMAVAAGLLMKENGNWNKRFDDMCCKTSGSKLARIEYPGAGIGLTSVEEMGE